MATQKPDLTRVWANGAPPGNVVDPDTTTPGKVLAGWQAEVPPFEHFNFLQKWFTQGLAHNNEQGINVWDSSTIYPVDGLVKGSNGGLFYAVSEQYNNDPVTDNGTNWRPFNDKQVIPFNTLSEVTTSIDTKKIFIGARINVTGRNNTNDGGGGDCVVIEGTSSANGFNIIAHESLDISIQLIDGGVGNLSRLGAISDGVTDNRAVMLFAAENYNHIKGRGHFAVSGLVDIKDNQVWDLSGSILTNTSDSVQILRSIGVNGWDIKGPVLLTGSSASPTSSDSGEKGITIENCLRYRVSDLEASNFGGNGIVVLGNVQPPINGETGQFTNVRSFNCYHSIDLSQGNAGEYTVWSNTNVGASRTCLTITAGNTTMHGGSITNAIQDGLVLLSGGNSAHGILSAFNFSHGTVNNLRCEDINNGFTFQGCHSYANNSSGSGKIVLNNSVGINWEGGIIDSWIEVDESAGKVGYNHINNAYCPGGLGGNALFDENGNRPKNVIVKGCFGPGVINPTDGNVTINDVGDCYVNARKLAGAPQSLTPNAATTLIFENVLRLGDNRRIYDNSTGEVTIPAQQAGQYSVRANCIFSGTTVDITNTYVDLLVNGVSEGFFYPSVLSVVGGETFTVQVESDIYLNDGDVVELSARVGSTAINFGAITDSTFTVNKVA